jgi:hypothetical protein
MSTPLPKQVYCSDLSIEAGEALYGTATQTQAYLLLEYAGNWGEKALDESSIPEPVKAYLTGLGKDQRGLKTLLIKTQPSQRPAMGVRFFVAALSVSPARLYAFHLADYESLLDLDIPAILAGAEAFQAHLRAEPLYLVCANGRRDLCCARQGLPVYNALAAATQASPEPLVWQCTHVGGHRFAANLICLPGGLLYGRVRPENAPAILEADSQGRIYLPNLRGRLSLPPVAQAAELYLRQQRHDDRLEAYRYIDSQESDSGEWVVRFGSTPGEEPLQVNVRKLVLEERTFESCSQEKSTPINSYQFRMAEE